MSSSRCRYESTQLRSIGHHSSSQTITIAAAISLSSGCRSTLAAAAALVDSFRTPLRHRCPQHSYIRRIRSLFSRCSLLSLLCLLSLLSVRIISNLRQQARRCLVPRDRPRNLHTLCYRR